ncbi:MAG: Fur family transcriptional regulator [Actinomycetaceae bacterium]|nr:Fur family transcriptional regulator [Actinomycetaceae bacterium]
MATHSRRNTKQRQAVIDALAGRDEFRSAQKIHEDMAQAGVRVGLATVYRNLRALAELNEIDQLLAPDGEALYRQCDSGTHHHHLVCRKCLRSEEIGAKAVERWMHSLAEEYGFTDLEHSLEVFGICSDCRKKPED